MARAPIAAAVAKPTRGPSFVTENELVMENPYLGERQQAAGHSPNHLGLATRKVCQNDEILDRFAFAARRKAPLTRLGPSHISAASCQRRERLFSGAFRRTRNCLTPTPLRTISPD